MRVQGRLPVVLPPETDERLSSWLTRMAAFYAMTVPEFVAELGLSGRNAFDLEWRLSAGEGALIAARTGVPEVALQAMCRNAWDIETGFHVISMPYPN